MAGDIKSVNFHPQLNSVVNTLNSLKVYSFCYFYGKSTVKYKAKTLQELAVTVRGKSSVIRIHVLEIYFRTTLIIYTIL